jgi:hypothetical protein
MHRAFRLVVTVGMLAGCAPEVVREPIVPPAAVAAGGLPDTIVLARQTVVHIGTGYDRLLEARTRWRLVGAIPQGVVYRAAQGVFTVEGANIHEAYLVLRGEELVGFYLPVEQAFSPLKDGVPLSIMKH